jgi:uncharacterized damage-inducible protein DinB
MTTNSPLARIDVAPTWRRFNDGLIRLVDYVPDDKMNWSPKPELWNFRGILLHIAATRDGWLGNDVKDGIEAPDVWRTVRSKSEIQEAYRRTWERVERFLRDEPKLDAIYGGGGGFDPVNGHWIAFHLLEHDIHHRADILHYLALLGIETPDVGTP